MRDFEVRPLTGTERPATSSHPPADLFGDEPDRVSFGSDRDERPGLLDRLRRIPAATAVVGRPMPRVAVAVISAVVAGTAVAVYLQPGEPTVPAPEPLPVLEPESWLDVREGRPFGPPPHPGEQQELVDEEMARHPPDALIVIPVSAHDVNLHGFPPGTYQVRLTCRPPAGAEPVSIGLDFLNDELSRSVPMEVPCDGEMQVRPDPFTVRGYQGYNLYYYPITDSPDDPWLGRDEQPVVVVSFTPLG